MPDIENVVKGLELCDIGSGDRCYETECPYYKQGCTESLKDNYLALLKEQDNEIDTLKTLLLGYKIGAITKEQEAVEQKWTSIKERYPEKEGFYLVSADNGNYHPWIAEMRIFNGIKGFCNGAVMPCIGAWMPLPEPFKEGR